MEFSELKTQANKIRYRIIELSSSNKIAHLASCLSTVDLLTCLYWKHLNLSRDNINSANRDRFILSKGHAALALYSTLNARGLWPEKLLESIGLEGSPLGEHPGPGCAPGIEWATGSLGHGLGAGLGMALGLKLQKENSKVCVLMSDGECNEGSVWEAAMLAPTLKLNNLCAIIDFNKWQATGRSQEIMQLDPLKEKWQAFGWQAIEIDGHNPSEICDALSTTATKPKAIIAHTVKGKGVSFMEDDNNWHYRIPNQEEVALAKGELLS